VPAAAVIPAPIAYIKVVAVKKLVVELWAWAGGLPMVCTAAAGSFLLATPPGGTRTITLRKLECSKQAFARIY
jgi:hypothetical protein